MKHYLLTTIILLIIGTLFLFFGMKGYIYITGVFYLIAASIIVYNTCPDAVKRAYFVLLSIGLIYFMAVEIPIVKNAVTDKNAERSYVVVLGAGVKGQQPTLSLIHRIQATEAYLTTYPDSKAILSGGQGPGEDIPEAEAMFRVLTENGIDADRLILEDKSTSTKENLELSKKMILSDGGALDDVAVISSPYHLFRAKEMAKDAGYEDMAGIACVHGYPIYSIGMYIREAFGVTHLWVFGD